MTTFLIVILIVFLTPITIYLSVRFAAFAWFKTRLEYFIKTKSSREEKW